MKRSFDLLTVALTVFALNSAVFASSERPGSRRVYYSGSEVIIVPPVPGSEPGEMVFTVMKTMSIPRLHIDELILYVEYSYFEDQFPDGSFKMRGIGTIMDNEMEVIGSYSFSNVGMYLTPPPFVTFITDGFGVGTIWAGPFAGVALTEYATLEVHLDFSGGPPVSTLYESLQDGALVIPRFVDIKNLQEGMAGLVRLHGGQGRH